LKDDSQKKLTLQLAIVGSEFFHAHLPILVRCKAKGAVGTVCAFLRDWQLPITVRDVAVTLADGRIFLKTSAPLFNENLSNEPNFGRIHRSDSPTH
jgi:hypothetical protein